MKTTPDSPDTSQFDPKRLVQTSLREGSILEESLAVIYKSDVLAKELGTSPTYEVVVCGRGHFIIAAEERAQAQAKTMLKPQWHYIPLADRLEAEIRELIKAPEIVPYSKVFDQMSRHMVYYGLAKDEAELIYASSEASGEDRLKIEQWRNQPKRWKLYDDLWRRVSDVTDIPVEDLHFLLIDEVSGLLKGGKIDARSIAERKAATWSLIIQGGTATIYLKDLGPEKNSFSEEEMIRGQTGFSSGSPITGVVGKDILVTKMTKPEVMAQLKGMKAVVTDEGGVLCHAAITCRELKIPCVVGTKIATRVLKAGDKVEVDSASGTVRKL